MQRGRKRSPENQARARWWVGGLGGGFALWGLGSHTHCQTGRIAAAIKVFISFCPRLEYFMYFS